MRQALSNVCHCSAASSSGAPTATKYRYSPALPRLTVTRQVFPSAPLTSTACRASRSPFAMKREALGSSSTSRIRIDGCYRLIGGPPATRSNIRA